MKMNFKKNLTYPNQKKNLLVAILFFVFTGGLFAYNFSADEETGPFQEEQRNVVIYDNLSNYDLNPHTASFTSEAQILTGLYEGLFSYDPVTLEAIPAICTSYKISRDKKRWTFTLRENAKFSDGSLITAQTIRDSWISLLENKNAPFASMIDFISGAKEFRNGLTSAENVKIEVRDEHTLVVRLDECAAHFPKLLCHHAFAAVSKNPNVYSGAFYLESYQSNTLIMRKNFNYWGSSGVLIPGIIVVQSDDYEENAYNFNVGKADWITGNANVQKIINKNSIQVSAAFGTTYLFFKINNEPWDKKEIRNALLEAIPYENLRSKYSVPATTLVYPLAGYNSVIGLDEYDEKEALEMMKLAREKYEIPQDERLSLVFACTTDSFQNDWAQILKQAWEPLGVDLIVQTTSPYLYNSSIPSWNADLFTYSWIGDFADPLAFLELFRSDSSLNVAHYKNSDFDNALIEASRCDSVLEQYKFLGKAEQNLLDDGMIIPIMHPVELHIIDLLMIGGWQTNALDIHPLKYLFIKHKNLKLPNMI